ncbi:hypothetical protein SISNIDRAFT_500143 [Sistotremastrum niveocremeum HHB9708]|uniref:Uncharacterized protein n=1 Tax=Sistotremastrum niveocremeum HHB9708 TaxID=1314777 RepID=A0A165AID4_9AGAM|nr:hypothetical protein SISNIDRAFT_500143 [Sistotremastrum niveocremeum HHB9708]
MFSSSETRRQYGFPGASLRGPFKVWRPPEARHGESDSDQQPHRTSYDNYRTGTSRASDKHRPSSRPTGYSSEGQSSSYSQSHSQSHSYKADLKNAPPVPALPSNYSRPSAAQNSSSSKPPSSYDSRPIGIKPLSSVKHKQAQFQESSSSSSSRASSQASLRYVSDSKVASVSTPPTSAEYSADARKSTFSPYLNASASYGTAERSTQSPTVPLNVRSPSVPSRPTVPAIPGARSSSTQLPQPGSSSPSVSQALSPKPAPSSYGSSYKSPERYATSKQATPDNSSVSSHEKALRTGTLYNQRDRSSKDKIVPSKLSSSTHPPSAAVTQSISSPRPQGTWTPSARPALMAAAHMRESSSSQSIANISVEPSIRSRESPAPADRLPKPEADEHEGFERLLEHATYDDDCDKRKKSQPGSRDFKVKVTSPAQPPPSAPQPTQSAQTSFTGHANESRRSVMPYETPPAPMIVPVFLPTTKEKRSSKDRERSSKSRSSSRKETLPSDTTVAISKASDPSERVTPSAPMTKIEAQPKANVESRATRVSDTLSPPPQSTQRYLTSPMPAQEPLHQVVKSDSQTLHRHSPSQLDSIVQAATTPAAQDKPLALVPVPSKTPTPAPRSNPEPEPRSPNSQALQPSSSNYTSTSHTAYASSTSGSSRTASFQSFQASLISTSTAQTSLSHSSISPNPPTSSLSLMAYNSHSKTQDDDHPDFETEKPLPVVSPTMSSATMARTTSSTRSPPQLPTSPNTQTKTQSNLTMVLSPPSVSQTVTPPSVPNPQSQFTSSSKTIPNVQSPPSSHLSPSGFSEYSKSVLSSPIPSTPSRSHAYQAAMVPISSLTRTLSSQDMAQEYEMHDEEVKPVTPAPIPPTTQSTRVMSPEPPVPKFDQYTGSKATPGEQYRLRPLYDPQAERERIITSPSTMILDRPVYGLSSASASAARLSPPSTSNVSKNTPSSGFTRDTPSPNAPTSRNTPSPLTASRKTPSPTNPSTSSSAPQALSSSAPSITSPISHRTGTSESVISPAARPSYLHSMSAPMSALSSSPDSDILQTPSSMTDSRFLGTSASTSTHTHTPTSTESRRKSNSFFNFFRSNKPSPKNYELWKPPATPSPTAPIPVASPTPVHPQPRREEARPRPPPLTPKVSKASDAVPVPGDGRKSPANPSRLRMPFKLFSKRPRTMSAASVECLDGADRLTRFVDQCRVICEKSHSWFTGHDAIASMAGSNIGDPRLEKQ